MFEIKQNRLRFSLYIAFQLLYATLFQAVLLHHIHM